jgi:hypothetical protein
MTIRHIVLFRFAEGTPDERVADLSAGLDALPPAIPQIRRYEHGRNLGVTPGTWDYGLVAEFDSVDDQRTYRDHPTHQQLIRELVEPITVDRASIQLSLD